MKKLTLYFILNLFTLVAYAEVQVDINPSSINENESFQLTLTRNGQGSGVPDLSVLQKDFIILGTARQMSYSVINGQSTSSSQWIITLKAIKTGLLSIPAIKVGSEHSTPITINIVAGVKKQNDFNPTQAQDVLLTTSTDNDKPYVNQQVLYTVKLYNSKRLLDADYQPPQVENALLIPLGNAKRYRTIKYNINYLVEEQKYALFPQKSGAVRIKSPSFRALVYAYDPQRIEVHDKNKRLNVQPIPKQAQGHAWLPAKQINITERYENEQQSITQGNTLVRTVTLEGTAVPAQLLPELHFSEGDLFSVYPEKGLEHNQVKGGELIGRTEFKVTYLFNKPGTVIIPELQVHWFNTQTGDVEEAILAPRRIDVTPSSSAVSSSTPKKPQLKSPLQHATSLPSSQDVAIVAQESNRLAWGVAVFFACAWLMTIIVWCWKKYSRTSIKKQQYIAFAQLKKACCEGKPIEARDALLKWAILYWPDASILNLSDISSLAPENGFKKQLNLLSQALYKDATSSSWHGDELLRAIENIKPIREGKVRQGGGLPPMNP